MTRMTGPHILAGDIGGTRARFALLDATGRRVTHQEVLESQGFATFEAALTRFLEGARKAGKVGKKAHGIVAASSASRRSRCSTTSWRWGSARSPPRLPG